MKRILLLLAPVLAMGQATDLPGPVNALPAAAASTGVCTWNKTQTKTACFGVNDTISALTSNGVFSLTDTYWQTDRGLQIAGRLVPDANLTESIGACQTSATCPSGLAAALEWKEIHVQNIYNYGPNPLSIYSDSGLIAIDAFASQPITFFTNNTLRAQITGAGVWSVGNLSGSGNRCTRVNNGGDFQITGADCLDPTAANTFSGLQTFSKNPVSIILSAEAQPATGIGGVPIVNLGDTTHQYLALFVDTIYDYDTSGALGVISNTQPIIIDAIANQPIQFYTQNTLRGSFLGSGTFELNSLAGSGTRCLQVNNSGDLAVASAACSSGSGDVTSLTAYKKISEGVGFFSSGSSTVATGLSIIDSAVCTISRSGGSATTEGCQIQGTSGGFITFLSTTGTGSSVFTWFAMGN